MDTDLILCPHGNLEYMCDDCRPRATNANYMHSCPHGMRNDCIYCSVAASQECVVTCVHNVVNTCGECVSYATKNYAYNRHNGATFRINCLHNVVTECGMCNVQRAEKLKNDYECTIWAKQITAHANGNALEFLRRELSNAKTTPTSRFNNGCVHQTKSICKICSSLQLETAILEFEQIKNQLNVLIDSINPTTSTWDATQNRVCKHTKPGQCSVCMLVCPYDEEFLNKMCGHNITRRACIICCMNAKCIHGTVRRSCSTCFSPEAVDALWKSDAKLVPNTPLEPTEKSENQRKTKKSQSSKQKAKRTKSKSTTEDVPNIEVANLLLHMASN